MRYDPYAQHEIIIRLELEARANRISMKSESLGLKASARVQHKTGNRFPTTDIKIRLGSLLIQDCIQEVLLSTRTCTCTILTNIISSCGSRSLRLVSNTLRT